MMSWLLQNWFSLLQTISIVASLLFAAFSIRTETRERRIENLFRVTADHRDIWTIVYEKPELWDVLKDSVPEGRPQHATLAEHLFVRSLILHLAATFRAKSYGMYIREEGLNSDVREFFSKPIPQAVWNSVKEYQEADFVRFVELLCSFKQ